MPDVGTTPEDLDLSLEDLRVVAAFALDSARPLLPLFESASPGDPRPRAAIDAAQAFVAGAPRSRLQRMTSLDAHRAAADAGEGPARYAARAAGDAAAAAYLHPIAKASQVGHILRATACAAHAAALAADDPAEADRVLDDARHLASPALVAILRRYPPVPTGRTPVARLMTRLDVSLRSAGG
ncbi:exonuclease SbcC [Aeromicrobium sp. Leaf272]|nr:exonuclease SbcC [Aeromicrobium sp. Leaf272]